MNWFDLWFLLALTALLTAVGFSVEQPCMERPGGCYLGFSD